MLSLAACTSSGPTEPSPDPTATTEAAVVGEDTTIAATVTRTVRLVTLGDAYTHGTETAAPRRDSWPAQLKDALERSGYDVSLWNLAEPSVSSLTLLEEQLGQVESLRPDVVTLQVGANDIIAGDYATQRDYRDNITLAFDELLEIVPSERILAITTPDHTLLQPDQQGSSPGTGRALVEELNATLRDVARERDIEVIDIGPVNSLAAHDPSLVVQEDPPLPYPYPTAKQYAGWAEVIGPYVHDALSTLGP